MQMKGTSLGTQVEKYTAAHRRKKKWLTAVTCLAVVMVLCVTYALIRPGVAMEKGREQDSAYAQHEHDASCYEEQSVLVCETAESSGHVHDDSCYTSVKGNLICENLDDGHEHSDECYEWTKELTCGLEEGTGAHQHSQDCYETQSVLTCGFEQAEAEAQDENSAETAVNEEAAKTAETEADLTEKEQTQADEGIAVQALTSNPLTEDAAYIQELKMGTSNQDTSDGITDGSAPWDSSDDDGLDKNADNRRVRTFDTVKYDFYYSTKLQDAGSTMSYDSARVYFEFLLPAEQSQAVFDVDEMSWLGTDGVSYVYEEEPVTIDGISCQVLHGSFLDERENSEITASFRSRGVMIRVLNMKNNSTIQPIFTMWLEPNDVGVTYENNIPTGIVYGSDYHCKQHGTAAAHNGIEYRTVKPDTVTVTCTPRYAVSLKRGEVVTTSGKGDYDFSTGNDQALDKDAGTWNGEISGYGIRLMVKGLDAEHGLRGCALPQEGDTLEFDISLVTSWKDDNASSGEWQYVTQEFTPRVWSADEFAYGTQGDGRVVGGYNGTVSYAAPLNKGTDKSWSCADGGTWTFAMQEYPWADQNHRVIHVTVSGYTFDPKHLPSICERGSATNTEFYNPTEVGDQWWNIQNAVFSTGEMWVVTPFYNAAGSDTANYITAVKETSSLTMKNSIFAWNLCIKDSEDGTVYSKTGQLHRLDASITLQQNPGSFNVFVGLLKPLARWNTPLTDGCFQSSSELKDYATPGSYADLETWVNNEGAEGDSAAVAYNVMTKFDDACFKPVTAQEMLDAGYTDNSDMHAAGYLSQNWFRWPEYNLCSDYKQGWDAQYPKPLYGTTKDKDGWNHNGLKPDQTGYDDEMMQATPDDLIWYDSMEALKADGAVCVAVMMEYRNVANDGTNSSAHIKMNHIHLVVHGKIKDTAETGYIYAISNYAAAWTKADVRDLVTAMGDKSGDGRIGTMDYLYYTQNYFPSYSPTAAIKMDSSSFPTPTHERSWDRCTYNGYGESGQNAVNGANGYGTAVKSYLDEDGTFIAGSGGYYFQDNVYVVGYKAEVGIQVAQKGGNGVARSTYDMDTNQRVADFMVTPRFVRSATDTGTGGATTTMYTDATVTVTLPKGLEYLYGTAVWDGSYVQDSACRYPGTVTGGQLLETTVVENADGTTTLTWVLKNVPLSNATEELAPIYFSCRIGDASDLENDVTNGQTLNVQTDIYSTVDQGVLHGTAYNNQANTSIRVSKSTALTIIKTADKPMVDIGEDMGFTMQVYNSSDSAYEGWIADILPYNNVGKTSFNGQLQIKEFKINDDDPQWRNVTFYYTTDTQYSSLQDVTNLDVSGWSTFQLDENYTWTPGEQEQQITAIAYQYNIPGKGHIQMHITLSLPDSQPEDVIHNHLLLNNLISNASTQIVARTLEGLTWLDDSTDGIQNETADCRLSGVKVTLLKLKDGGDPEKESDYEAYCYTGTQTPVTVETGKQISVRAAGADAATVYEQGRYRFTDLPAGTFAVRFEDGTTQINGLIASPSNSGTDDTQDSDGIAAYTDDHSSLTQTMILGVKLPKVEDISVTLYESRYHDSGFYAKSPVLPKTGGIGTIPYTLGGALLLTGAGVLLVYKKRRKENLASF